MKARLRAATLVLLACGFVSFARAEKPLPDWVLQAASAKLPVYPPEAKAVVLLRDQLVTVQPDGKATQRLREVIKILRPQGREYAEILVWFSKDRKLNSFHSWSIGPDGHQYTVKDDQVREVGAEDAAVRVQLVEHDVAQPLK